MVNMTYETSYIQNKRILVVKLYKPNPNMQSGEMCVYSFRQSLYGWDKGRIYLHWCDNFDIQELREAINIAEAACRAVHRKSQTSKSVSSRNRQRTATN